MKKSEVIKLMKEGTHCIYNDCPDKEPILMEITKEHVSRIYYRFYYRYLDGGVQASNFPFKELEMIKLSEIEPDNEKPYLFYEGEKYYFGEEYEFSNNKTRWRSANLIAFNPQLENKFTFDISSCRFIRKIDHTSKYKTKLEELKQQAEKDGVNLKELL